MFRCHMSVWSKQSLNTKKNIFTAQKGMTKINCTHQESNGIKSAVPDNKNIRGIRDNVTGRETGFL